MKFIDLFAGVGGFRRGMELAGHECIGFCEFDKYATASYTSMHLATDDQLKKLKTMKINERKSEILKEEYRNGEWYKKDIKEVTGENIPRADCWCFGAPCQDFSVAGTRSGLKGDRSSLVREVFRILGEIKEEHRPEWIIYENVKGMLSSHKGFDFLAILLEMDELGYDVEWRIFNSKDYGVPQNRERVYTVGHLRRYGFRKIFSEEGASGENNIFKVGDNSSNDMVKIAKYPSGNQKADIFGVDGVSRTLIASDYKQPVSVAINPEVIGGVGDINFGKQWRQGNRIYNGDKVATALEASPVGNAGGMTNLYSVKLDDEKKGDPKIDIIGHRDGYRRNLQTFSPTGVTETLDTAGGGGRGHHVALPIEIIGTLDPKRHSQMDIHGISGIMSCLDTINEKKKIAICLRGEVNAKRS